MCRPRALMIPWLTECVRPNGLPRARTQVPTAASSLLPRRAAGRSSRSELEDGDVGLGVEPDPLGVERPAVVQEDADLRAAGPPRRRGCSSGRRAPCPRSPRTITPEPVSSNRADVAVLARADLRADDVDHRRRDGPGHQLERPVDVRNCSYCRSPSRGRARPPSAGVRARPRPARPALAGCSAWRSQGGRDPAHGQAQGDARGRAWRARGRRTGGRGPSSRSLRSDAGAIDNADRRVTGPCDPMRTRNDTHPDRGRVKEPVDPRRRKRADGGGPSAFGKSGRRTSGRAQRPDSLRSISKSLRLMSRVAVVDPTAYRRSSPSGRSSGTAPEEPGRSARSRAGSRCSYWCTAGR